MNFINTELFHYYEDRGSSLYYFQFWTGLSYYSEIRKWIWADGTILSSGLIQLPDPSHGTDAGGACVYLQVGAVKLGRCEEALFCICEKMKKPVRKN
ncbi:hypothetical protein Y1Q_0010532 [Alligator mississippiensis]|uniref:C-type lectin domain-containing protein n=1 Tax=Alligator mississippiensis TaxID=8496 RepID=A0A151NDC2_ALLMI|nr:hypothetical protein Y1Q_0010532 [Alligator mississippiensis]